MSSERLGNFPKGTQLLRGRAKSQAQVCLPLKSQLFCYGGSSTTAYWMDLFPQQDFNLLEWRHSLLISVFTIALRIMHKHSAFFFYLFFRERQSACKWGRGARRERERESQKGYPPGTEPDTGLDLTTLRSRLEPKSKVSLVTDRVTQAPRQSIFNTSLLNKKWPTASAHPPTDHVCSLIGSYHCLCLK